MNPVIRNFLSVIRRFKMAVILNVFGLSVAFASFMIIMIQVDFDRNFDRFHADADKIFRVEFANPDGVFAIITRPLAEKFFESSPAIVAGAIADSWPSEAFLSTETASGERRSFEEHVVQVSPSFTDVFAFDFTEGDPAALNKPETVIIPQSMSRRMFGDEPAIGKQLTIEGQILTVGGVYRDLPANSILQNIIYYAIAENENKSNWGIWNYYTYIRVNDAAAVPGLWDNFKKSFDAKETDGKLFGHEIPSVSLRLTALPDIHYITDVQSDDTPKASHNSIAILTATVTFQSRRVAKDNPVKSLKSE